MKKLLIATAALAMVAGTAQAQSSVQVYGILDLGYSDQKHSADASFEGFGANASESFKQVNGKSGLSGSRLGFKGTEDLGGGLKAGFVYELGLNTESTSVDKANAMTVRAANVSLSGGFGGLTIGRQNSIGKNMNDQFTAFGGGGSFTQGSVVHTVTGNAGSGSLANDVELGAEIKPLVDRISNAVTYTSPKIGGLTVTLQANEKSSDLSTDEGKIQSSAQAIRADYAAGKLNVSVAYTDATAKEEGPSTKADADLTQVGVSYDFGAAKVFLAYADADGKNETNDTVNSKGTDIGVIVPVSPKVNLLASYGTGDVKYASGSDTAKIDVDGYMLQAHYSLSKRTTAYAMYAVTDMDATYSGSSLKLNGEDKVTMIGVRHSF
jgi:predicted porin